MNIKTGELKEIALDWAVAIAEGLKDQKPFTALELFRAIRANGDFHYSCNWSEAGPIIEREWVELINNGQDWIAIGRGFGEDAPEGLGSTPLIAAMRCYVASKLGDCVDIPDQLTQTVHTETKRETI